MSATTQFWWNWGVTATGAICTFLAVLAALFGDWIRNKLFRPKLTLTLRDHIGERTPMTLIWSSEGQQKEEEGQARFYHVQVSNSKRWPPASNVQVFLIKVEEPGPDGTLQITWSGEAPIRWRHHEIYPPAKIVGPQTDCDLCSVVKNTENYCWLDLHPLIIPRNLESRKRQATNITISLQARSNEADSVISRFKIAWDGKWEEGDAEMAKHLVLTSVTK